MIAGGGCGALAAAFALTDRPADRIRFAVTVLQPGWRLGGKGASGRNAQLGQRIEEHGLHIWSGFYENAFWMMRKCYGALSRPASAPLASLFAAFRPRHYTAMAAPGVNGDAFAMWKGYLPHETGLPGDAIAGGDYAVNEPVRSPWDLLLALAPWGLRYFQATTAASGGDVVERLGAGQWWLLRMWLRQRSDAGVWRRRWMTVFDAVLLAVIGLRLLCAIRRATRFHDRQAAPPPTVREAPAPYRTLAARLRCLQRWISRKRALFADGDLNERSLFELSEVFVTVMIGMLEDNVIERGFDSIDDRDLKRWLTGHGAAADVVDGPTLQALYCYIFAYEDGDPARPLLAAGVALRFAFRLILCSRGAVFWDMAAGMGDAVFAPLYEVLKQRGVEFKFFHRVAEVQAGAPGHVDAVVVERQLAVKAGADYQPLVDVGGLSCWPNQPLVNQLDLSADEAAHMLACRRELESVQAPWPGSCQQTWHAGQDFDHLILAMSIEPLKTIAPTLLVHNPALRAAVEGIKTVATVSMQLWTQPDTQALGWLAPAPVLTSYAKPFDTWADMSHVLAAERWPGPAPRGVHYFCGPWHEPPGVAAAGRSDVERAAGAWLHDYIGELWPRAIATHRSDRSRAHPFLDGVLFDPQRPATADLASQWFSLNHEPAERYVLSLPGTTRHRLRATATGVSNLSIAGDWLHTGLNYGCVEAAVIGGFQAARGVCGYPERIHGEDDFATPSRDLNA